MGTAPINSSEYIFKLLRSEILSLTLKPGQALSENELCQRFSVSRTPIRSVLQRLSNAGLVKVVPYKGSFVTLLNFDDICQMIYLRIAVESAVIRDFIGLCTPILEEKLRYIIRKQMVLTEGGSFGIGHFYELDSQFHEIWYKATHKERLWHMIQRSQVNYTRFRVLDIVEAQNAAQIIEEHQELFRIIHDKRYPDVEPLIRKHMNGGINRLGSRIGTELKDYFQQEPNDPVNF